MLTARAFCSARRSAGLPSGLVPPLLTAIAMSLPILVNCFATRSIRAKIVCLRFSKARPTAPSYNESGPRDAGIVAIATHAFRLDLRALVGCEGYLSMDSRYHRRVADDP